MADLRTMMRSGTGGLVKKPGVPTEGEGQLLAAGGTPTSPLAAATGGAQPDAAKMAGTPFQTSAPTLTPRSPVGGPQAAAPAAAPTGPTLQEAVRQEAAQPPQQTEIEKKRAETLNSLKASFGEGMGGRINNVIDSALQKMTASVAATAGPTVTVVAGSAFPTNSSIFVSRFAGPAPKVDMTSMAGRAEFGKWKKKVDQARAFYTQAQKIASAATPAEADKAYQEALAAGAPENLLSTYFQRKTGLALTPEASQLPAEAQTALTALKDDPANPLKVGAALKALGLPPTTAPTELGKYIQGYGDVAGAAAKAAAAAAPDQILLTPDVIKQLTPTGAAEWTPDSLAKELGVPVGEIAGMSIADLQKKVADAISKEESAIQAARDAVVDPKLGPNERAAARTELARLGATGAFATERDLEDLQGQVDSAAQAKIGDKTYSLGELLSDQNVTDMATQYFSDPKFAETLKKDKPELAKFYDANQNTMQELLTRLDTGGTQFQTAQKAGAALMNSLTPAFGGDSEAASAFMKKLIPDYDPYSGKVPDTKKFPMLAALADPGAAGMEPSLAYQQFAQLGKMDSETAAWLVAQTPEQLKKLGFGTREGEERWKATVSYGERRADALRKAEAGDSEAAVDFIFGPEASVDQVQQLVQTESALAAAGIETEWWKKNKHTLDRNSDGKLDDVSQLASRVREMPSLRGMLQKGKEVPGARPLPKGGGKLVDRLMQEGGDLRALVAKLGDRLPEGDRGILLAEADRRSSGVADQAIKSRMNALLKTPSDGSALGAVEATEQSWYSLPAADQHARVERLRSASRVARDFKEKATPDQRAYYERMEQRLDAMIAALKPLPSSTSKVSLGKSQYTASPGPDQARMEADPDVNARDPYNR